MVCSVVSRTLKRILVRVPNDLRETWVNAPSDIFEEVTYNNIQEQWLRLFPTPVGGWVKRREYQNSELSPIVSSLDVQINYSKVLGSFSFKTEETRAEVFSIVENLVDISSSTVRTQYTPIVILDYCTPGYSNLLTSLGGGVDTPKERQGAIVLRDTPGMVGAEGGPYFIPGGFSFTFLDLELTNV